MLEQLHFILVGCVDRGTILLLLLLLLLLFCDIQVFMKSSLAN